MEYEVVVVVVVVGVDVVVEPSALMGVARGESVV